MINNKLTNFDLDILLYLEIFLITSFEKAKLFSTKDYIIHITSKIYSIK